MSEYIKREDAIKDLQIFASYIENPDYMVSKSVLRVLKGLPSIDVVERKRGEWLFANKAFFCSVCNKEAFSQKFTMLVDDPLYFRTPFCPHCGADMRVTE